VTAARGALRLIVPGGAASGSCSLSQRFSRWSRRPRTRGLRLSRAQLRRGKQRSAAAKGGLIEGFTYRFRDPRRGEIVNFHIRGRIGEPVAPDPFGSEFIAKRVIGVPGDIVTWRNARVLVNGKKADEIPTSEFASVRLGFDEPDLPAPTLLDLGRKRSRQHHRRRRRRRAPGRCGLPLPAPRAPALLRRDPQPRRQALAARRPARATRIRERGPLLQ
jgi:hypothetical protein